MGDDFQLPNSTIFPSSPRTDNTAPETHRPRRKSIDTPALKLDTSVVVSVIESISVSDFPPPPNAASSANVTRSPGKKAAPQKIKASSRNGSPSTTPLFRSMFPRLPITDRNSIYSHAVGQTVASHYSPSIYSHPQSPAAALIAGHTTSRLSHTFFQQSQLRVVEVIPEGVSSAEESLGLWTLTAGEEGPRALPQYKLHMKCDSLRQNFESISLRSTTSELFRLSVAAGTINIARLHPLGPSNGVNIVTTTFQIPSTTSPVVAVIFPNEAGSEAWETANRAAIEAGLSPEDATRAEDHAVEIARATQAGHVVWDSDSSRYYFALPTLGTEGPATIFPVEIVRDSHIRFLDSSHQPLVTLNLMDYTVEIGTHAVTAVSNSIHTMDILISALLLLSVHLHRTQSMLSEPAFIAPQFDPPPKSAVRETRKKQQKPSPNTSSPWVTRLNPVSRAGSKNSHLHPYHNGTQNASTITFEKDIELGMLPHHIAPMTTAPIPENGIAPELRGSNTGVDLSQFQAFDLNDPNLGTKTKVVLRIIYLFFGVLVWILGTGVGVVAGIVVAIGGGVKKRRVEREA